METEYQKGRFYDNNGVLWFDGECKNGFPVETGTYQKFKYDLVKQNGKLVDYFSVSEEEKKLLVVCIHKTIFETPDWDEEEFMKGKKYLDCFSKPVEKKITECYGYHNIRYHYGTKEIKSEFEPVSTIVEIRKIEVLNEPAYHVYHKASDSNTHVEWYLCNKQFVTGEEEKEEKEEKE
jgi:hypothetical protein